MLYSPKKYKGLGVIKVEWEQQLQQLSICQKLRLVNDESLHFFRNFEEDMKKCLISLQCDPSNTEISTRIIRQDLREKAFTDWQSLRSHGLGVCLFSHY